MPKQQLNPENYLELWKYFTDDAAKIKDRMWTIASFFFAAITALSGFMVSNILQPDRLKNPTNNQYLLIIVCSVIFFGLCIYFKYMIRQYGYHIFNGWKRTNYLRTQIEGLSVVWFAGDSKKADEDFKGNTVPEFPPEALRLIGFANYIAIFYALFLVGLIFLYA
jgi:hypothetical protein